MKEVSEKRDLNRNILPPQFWIFVHILAVLRSAGQAGTKFKFVVTIYIQNFYQTPLDTEFFNNTASSSSTFEIFQPSTFFAISMHFTFNMHYTSTYWSTIAWMITVWFLFLRNETKNVQCILPTLENFVLTFSMILFTA